MAPRRRRTEARRLIRKALAHKRAALRALPRALNPKCVSKRIPYGSNVSIQTNGCAQPVSSIVYTTSSKFSVFGNSILPGDRHALCKKLNPRATRWFFNPALQPGASFFADITPKPNGPVSITTFNGAGQVVATWTATG